ncbi:MAG: selenium-binding protein, partial [Actinobacteria bacterium]|nr:selenium-binding protein [Actinomycetota bacterium]
MAAAQVGYSSPREAMTAPREEILYVAGLYEGTGVDEPDFLAVVDVDPNSGTYSEVVHRTSMPNVGDELHHYGWQVCSSACHTANHERKHLVVPGLRSSRIHIVDVATDPRAPIISKVIEPEEVKAKTGLSGPHTVHCMPGDNVVMSMLGDADGGKGSGYLVLDAGSFEIKGRWEANGAPEWGYDFWYQPRHNTLLSSEWAAPEVFLPGFDLEDVAAGKYGHSIHFWDLAERRVTQSIDLGEAGMIPLEIRWLHDPDAATGFVGAALSSVMWRFYRDGSEWAAERVIEVEPRDLEGFPVPVPGLITDLVLSMDDRFLFFSNWLHGDLRSYDVSDPAHPRQVGSVPLGGLFEPASHPNGSSLDGGPQMLQLSMDGKRLYVSNSLFSTWDNQFYP